MGNSASQIDTIWAACSERERHHIIDLGKSKDAFLKPPQGTDHTRSHFDFDTNYEDVLAMEKADPNLACRMKELVPSEISVSVH
jgi:hypothetical protein